MSARTNNRSSKAKAKAKGNGKGKRERKPLTPSQQLGRLLTKIERLENGAGSGPKDADIAKLSHADRETIVREKVEAFEKRLRRKYFGASAEIESLRDAANTMLSDLGFGAEEDAE